MAHNTHIYRTILLSSVMIWVLCSCKTKHTIVHTQNEEEKTDSLYISMATDVHDTATTHAYTHGTHNTQTDTHIEETTETIIWSTPDSIGQQYPISTTRTTRKEGKTDRTTDTTDTDLETSRTIDDNSSALQVSTHNEKTSQNAKEEVISGNSSSVWSSLTKNSRHSYLTMAKIYLKGAIFSIFLLVSVSLFLFLRKYPFSYLLRICRLIVSLFK